MTGPDLSRLSALELAGLVLSKKASSTEILDAHLGAIMQFNPGLNAIVTLAEDQAREAARRADDAVARGDRLGPLHGLPVVIKDITPTAGIRTTYGSPVFKDHVPAEDAEVVTRLRSAGAIILGKTNTPEFATGANTVNAVFGATRNPWDPSLSPAGSSGGSAVAVATGMVPLAQGTDFGCSIRIPASFCGIVGLRPTAGLIPNRPMPMAWDPGQVHGPLARSAVDAALMLESMLGLDPLWPISVSLPEQSVLAKVLQAENAKGLRVAYASDIAGIGVDSEVDRICRRSVELLSQSGAYVEDITFDASDGIDAYKTLRGFWMVGQQLERVDHLEAFGSNLAGNVRDGLKLDAKDLAIAERKRQEILMRFGRLFQDYDFLVTPAAPVLPYPVEWPYPDRIGGRRLDSYMDWVAPAFLVTLVGFPAVSVPAGLSSGRLPVGMQIIGRRFAEAQILSLAKLVHQASSVGWPSMFSDAAAESRSQGAAQYGGSD